MQTGIIGAKIIKDTAHYNEVNKHASTMECNFLLKLILNITRMQSIQIRWIGDNKQGLTLYNFGPYLQGSHESI